MSSSLYPLRLGASGVTRTAARADAGIAGLAVRCRRIRRCRAVCDAVATFRARPGGVATPLAVDSALFAIVSPLDTAPFAVDVAVPAAPAAPFVKPVVLTLPLAEPLPFALAGPAFAPAEPLPEAEPDPLLSTLSLPRRIIRASSALDRRRGDPLCLGLLNARRRSPAPCAVNRHYRAWPLAVTNADARTGVSVVPFIGPSSAHGRRT